MAKREEDDPTGVQLSIRVPASALRRAEALTAKIAKNQTAFAMGKITRSGVMRLAFLRGLDSLEAENK